MKHFLSERSLAHRFWGKARHELSSRKAIPLLKRVIKHQPSHALAHYALGQFYEVANQVDEALIHYHAAVYFHRNFSEAYYRLGHLYEQGRNWPQTLKYFRRYLDLDPNPKSAVFVSLAMIMESLKQNEQAIHFYFKALEKDPLNTGLYITLAEALQANGNLDLSLEFCMALAKIHPERAGLVSALMGYILEKNGEYELALRCYDEAILKTPQYLPWQVKRDFTLPFIAQNNQEIDETRVRMSLTLQKALAALSPFPPVYPRSLNSLTLSMMQSALTYTCYHAQHSHELRALFGEFASLISPFLEHAPSQVEPTTSSGQPPYHMGVIFKPQNINMCFSFNGEILNRLDSGLFKITIYSQSEIISELFDSRQKYHFTNPNISWKILPPQWDKACDVLSQESLDVLMYTEPYWDTYQYNLAMFKPVRLQITSWMNPGSVGLKQIDYFISSELLEGEDSQSHYVEKLICLPTLPTYLSSFVFETELTRADFGLEEDWHVYASPQNILKFQPDFDKVIKGVLEADPDAVVVLLSTDKQQHLSQQLLKRFQSVLPDVMSRILFMPQLKNYEFLSLLKVSDLILDPFYYGGGTTSYQALGLGKAIVTRPSAYMVGKITAAMYEQMGLTGLVAKDSDEFIQIALRLGMDSNYRNKIEAEILSKKHHIFEDGRVVSAFSDFLLEILKAG